MSRGPVRVLAGVASIAIAILASGCVTAVDGGTGGTPATDAELTVFAAASLAAAFDEIAADFERSRPGVRVVVVAGPSDGLAVQIRSEGVADVFASASGAWMDVVADDPGVRQRIDFVRNHLVLVTPPANPAGIDEIADLAEPGVQLILAAEGVPVGDYAREALTKAGIAEAALANVVSNEEDNAAVVGKIAGGEADAAIVYASDVSAAAGNDLLAIELPDDVDVTATYPIAVVEGSPNADLAGAFVSFVTGAQGQAVLEDYGFDPIE